MIKKKEHKKDKIFHEICNYLGENLDAPLCKEVKEHLESCPQCKEFIDSIKQTVKICKESEKNLKTPKNCKDNILKYIQKVSVEEKR